MNDIMTTTLLDYFATENHIRLKQEWLECAINYLSVSGTSRTRYNGMLFEQWLYSDIGESTLPCLKNVFNGKKLNGVIVLQVVSAADDGSSFHSQSSQLPYRANDSSKFQYESEVHNFRRNAGSNRIQMVLSDGRDQVKAVEHNPIPYLSALIRPGCKVLLYGAIGVTQGIFLLEPNNCQVLGGDVEIRPPLAATSTSSLGDLAAFFSQYHIRIRQEWLECAVKYISTSRADKTFHSGIIFEQWLYSDIGESTLPCLKEAISGNTLNGVIVLQVVSVLGGDSPLPIELKQLVYEKNDNDVFQYPDTAASSRIHIVLSDGRDEIKAVEHKAIPHLLDFLRPGCKVLLYGCIPILRGFFILEPNNCQVLGGDSEMLMESVEIMQSSVPAPASSVDDLVVFFTQYHIRMKKEWLECAVKYVSLSNKSESCHGGLVFEQWLYSDIGESTLPCLKDAIKGNALNSVIVLQVVSVLDVGSPLLGQFNKLTYEANDNAEFRCEDEGQNTSLNVASRCLRLTLSDGATEVSALEYRPVPQLSLLICPGCKILLFGLIRMRCGLLLLDQKKLLFVRACFNLGGDVISLMMTSRPVEMMSQKLNKPIPSRKKPV